MNIIWTEEAIRSELARLDRITGLQGAALPIKFSNAKCTLGMYHSANGGSFTFSKHYYHNPDWPMEEAIDTIRHEYAHYMDHRLNGVIGHGHSWKKCCIKIGAMPLRLYNREMANHYAQKHLKDRELSDRCDIFQPDVVISHPTFGKGSICEIHGVGSGRIASVTFNNGTMTKKLALAWMLDNCTLEEGGM